VILLNEKLFYDEKIKYRKRNNGRALQRNDYNNNKETKIGISKENMSVSQ
jgi:hypothetical protein